jgi:tetratricopeptide (TPR) repeat protein
VHAGVEHGIMDGDVEVARRVWSRARDRRHRPGARTTRRASAPAAPAATAAPVAPRPSADEQRRYRAALARARTAEHAGNLKLAARAFTDCLQILPDDPVALGELGVVQLRAGQLADAEATSRKAIEHSQSPTVRAAALFNLGYVLVKRGDPRGAIEAYQSSLRLRVNPTVEAELRKLDPAAAAALRFVPRPMRSAPPDTPAVLKERCWKAVAEAWPELEATAADVSDRHFDYACSEIIDLRGGVCDLSFQ